MVEKPHGRRNKTRHKLQKKPRERGMVPVARFFTKFEPGEKVLIKIDPSQHHGMPYKNFHGSVGVIKAKRGQAYLIEVKDKHAMKTIISTPIHLRKMA